jgi:hypothetical protein
MRTIGVLTIVSAFNFSPAISIAADKLTMEDRIEITRGMTAEYAKLKALLPRSKKALEFNADGTYNKKQWSDIAKESGPAARVGDLVQITKVDISDDRLTFDINGGFKGGKKWYQGVQIGMNGNTAPVSRNESNAPGGTSIVLLFHKPIEPIKATEIKKILSAVLDFDKRSATELYSESLPPEVQQAIKEKRAREGMNHEQVVMAMGRPAQKSRETKDGIDLEDWVYGMAPGKITFVTFKGDTVIKVKESYAGLGTQVQQNPVPR